MRKKMTALGIATAGFLALSIALPADADAHHRYRYYGYPTYGHGFSGYGYVYGPYAVDGSVRIEVNPKDSRAEIEVYVDGGLAGVVNDFDGALQRLRLPPGKHEIELRLDGYETKRVTVFVERGGTFYIRGEMMPLRAM